MGLRKSESDDAMQIHVAAAIAEVDAIVKRLFQPDRQMTKLSTFSINRKVHSNKLQRFVKVHFHKLERLYKNTDIYSTLVIQ